MKMIRKGRPSKILTYNLIEDVERLRNSGLSYQKIAEEINSKLPPHQQISKDCINRYFLGKTKQLEDLQNPIDIIEDLQEVFRQIIFNIEKLKSLDYQDKKAIKGYVRGCERALETKMNRFYRGHADEINLTEYERVRDFVLHFSRTICPECRRKVVAEVLKMEQEQDKAI